MTLIYIEHMASKKVLADKAVYAVHWLGRLIGWLGKKRVAPGDGLYLTHCSSIHTFGMQFPIDVIFLDNRQRVVRTISHLGLFKIAWARCFSVLELPAGTLDKIPVQTGDLLGFLTRH